MIEKEGYVAELNGKYLGRNFDHVCLTSADKAFLWANEEHAKIDSSHYGFHILNQMKINKFNIMHVKIKTEVEVL